ncbi:LacI family DNA-binding transcriptional regulator, partial [Micromonospora sp. H61]|nr:LacI family DNA-binding transcriptional regulator [Micromonospora sp. H61]
MVGREHQVDAAGGREPAGGSPLRIAELAALVDNRLARDGLKLREAAAQAGVSAATLSRVLNSKVRDTATFAVLVRWLGVSADLFIDRDREVSGAEAIEAHLRSDRTLPASDREGPGRPRPGRLRRLRQRRRQQGVSTWRQQQRRWCAASRPSRSAFWPSSV